MDKFEGGMYFFVKNVEFSSFNQIINNVNLKILEHGFLNAGRDWNFPGLSSPFNRLYFVTSGNATITNKYNNIELKSGNVYLVPLYNTYDYICNSELQKFYIHFRIELISGHDLFEGSKECLYFPYDPNKLNELLSGARDGHIGNLIKCKGILLEYIGRFITAQSGRVSDQVKLASKYSELYEYVKSNCFADLRVTNIAEYLNTSVSNLSKKFKNDTGLSLKKYIDSKIVQKAQEMLLTTNMSVKEVSRELKFLDEFHFSRFFKNRTGISPNKYRQRNNSFK